MFPSPSILQHYTKFDPHTISTLKKLLGARFFGGSIDHLIHHQSIIPVFLGELNFPSIIQISTSTFLGCWALIIATLVNSFLIG
jgi:hypothetical protein